MKRTPKASGTSTGLKGRKQKDRPDAGNDSGTEKEFKFLQSEGLLARILDIADDAIISIDQDQRIVIFNQGAEKIFGFTAREVWGKPLSDLLPDRFVAVHSTHVQDFGRSPMAARRMGQRREIAGRRKDGTEFPAEASISKVDIEGRRIYTVILRDTTLRRAAEDKLKASLREKEVLLKEVHHRVKNNLQVISSLLKLQARGIHDEPTRQKFKESEMRVLSMALIHEQLYQSKSLSEINFPEYIRQLAGDLFRSYRVSSSRVELKTEIEDVPLSVDIAVPCGLIINELVSNALKYAYPEGREGEIRVQLRSRGTTFTLSVSDNGVGIPERVGFQDTKTLGLRLVGTLVRQLEGEVQIDRSRGTEVRVTFALESQ